MRYKNLLNYAFIVGLIVLVLNDHVLKEAFGNWYTGKLSDFAGVFILPMFIKFLFSTSTRKSIVATVLFFAFWKSPFSQFIIDNFNSIGLFSINRVIDYTDLIAFMMLPLSLLVLDNIEKFEIKLNYPTTQRLATNLLLFFSVIAFVATSQDEDFEDLDPSVLVANCCFNNPVIAEVGAGNIYIPTIFTPDGNGLNDVFQISADDNIARIDTFLVTDQITGNIVFNKINITEITADNGFDGLVSDTIIATQYLYQIIVTSTDSVRQQFFGAVCCIPCQEALNLPSPDSIGNCAYPIQYDMINGYDDTIDPGEDLDCFN